MDWMHGGVHQGSGIWLYSRRLTQLKQEWHNCGTVMAPTSTYIEQSCILSDDMHEISLTSRDMLR